MSKKLIYLVSLVLLLSFVGTNVSYGGKVWESRIISDSDDVEERENGSMDLSSSDLEIFNDGGVQVIGLRFVDLPIPKGAIVENAFIEITCDETKGGTQPVSVLIAGELNPNPPTFANVTNNVTNRPTTTANMIWAPEIWTEEDQTARSLDIASVIQEIIDQDGWAMGNALVLILRDDPDNPSEGIRCADSRSVPDNAPLLHIEFRGKFAVDPTPADGALYEDTTAILSWLPGLNSVSHDVYFGENFTDVSEGTPDTFQGNQTDNFFTVGIPGFPVPDGLVPGTTYYWRIDEIEADGTTINKGDIWSFTFPSLKAYNHNLSDGACFIEPSTKLSWTPGFGAKVHTVFFGDNYDDVNNAVEGLPQAASTYDPGPLESNRTYYWRVDEYDGVETHKGDTLSFTTIGARGIGLRGDYYSGQNFDTLELTRIDPQIDFPWGGNPPDAALGGSNISVRWTGDFSAQFTETYTFYTISDDGVRLWVDGKLILENWTAHGDSEDTGTIDLVAGQFYSIVLEYYQGGGGSIAQLGIKGPRTEKQLIPTSLLWPPIKARNPNPSNGAVDVTQTPVLLWSAGEAAASHEVYFGTDADVVENADTSSPEHKGSRDLGSESYDPGQLEWNTTYYWRIDEIEDGGTIQRGNVWSFTTANFLIIDDIESYNDIDDGEPGSNRIYNAWIDGLINPANGGSTVGHLDPPFYEETIVHSGTKSMPLAYDNAVGKSEATLTLTSNRDWTVKGVDTLAIWYIGDAANAAETMYVVLNGTAMVTNDNPDAAQATAWTEWTIDLQAFGVNLTNVNTITLGFGNRTNPVAGGSGMVFFDDIRLYAPAP
ncbi:MAG: PA14 domain-containing protein [Planctomycetota bacterium]|jgi:hypothetical protein